MPRSIENGDDTTTSWKPSTVPRLLIAHAYASVVNGMNKKPRNGQSHGRVGLADVVAEENTSTMAKRGAIKPDTDEESAWTFTANCHGRGGGAS
jgi:hypothetical protein